MILLPIAQMHQQFRIEYDSIDSLSNPEYSPEEVDIFLNNAQDELYEKAAVEGIERTQILRDYLSNVTTTSTIALFLNNASNHPNGVFTTLPDNYRIMISESCTINYTTCTGASASKRIPVIPITHDEYNLTIRDPFKRPSHLERVISLPYEKLVGATGQTIQLITDGTFTITGYHVTYIRDAAQMQYGTTYATPTLDVDCELGTEAQSWIISQAVKLAFQATNQLQKVQVLSQLGK